MTLKDALAYVKGRRSVVNPNEGFLSQLRDYEGILRARYMQCVSNVPMDMMGV